MSDIIYNNAKIAGCGIEEKLEISTSDLATVLVFGRISDRLDCAVTYVRTSEIDSMIIKISIGDLLEYIGNK